VTAYDGLRLAVSLQLRWAKGRQCVARHRPHGYLEHFLPVDSNAPAPTSLEERQHDFTFSPNGQMKPAYRRHHPDGADHRRRPSAHLDQLSAPAASPSSPMQRHVKVNQIQQDGLPAGSLQTVSIGQNGRVVGTIPTPQHRPAQISVATFTGTNFLKRIDGAHSRRRTSRLGAFGSGGTIVGSSLESSNTDIADESPADRDPAGLFGQHQGDHHSQLDGSGSAETFCDRVATWTV